MIFLTELDQDGFTLLCRGAKGPVIWRHASGFSWVSRTWVSSSWSQF